MAPARDVCAEPHSEEDWIAAARHGDQAAFRRLVERYHRLVVRLAYRLTGDAHMADDIAQETFLQAWLNLAGFVRTRPGGFRAWLCRIAHNRAVDALRRERVDVPLSAAQSVPAQSQADQVARTEGAAVVQNAVLGLPPPLRAVIVLREYEELTYAEIAAALGIPVGTVMSRLHNARRRLAAELMPLDAIEVR